jgi:hypothetical protein
MRIFAAGLQTETNTFAPWPTGLADFRLRQIPASWCGLASDYGDADSHEEVARRAVDPLDDWLRAGAVDERERCAVIQPVRFGLSKLVTDAGIPGEAREALTRSGVEVIIA